MSPKFKSTRLPGVLLVEPEIHRDFRGYFLEISQKLKYEAGGIPTEFVQTNFSSSVKGTLRGLHYQYQNPQGKLLTVLQGEIFDVAVDVRPNSPTFREWVGVRLRAEDKGQIFVPAGFAHGFCVLSERADVFYQCTDYYNAEDERGILWSDPKLGIEWPSESFILSEKDRKHPTLDEILARNGIKP